MYTSKGLHTSCFTWQKHWNFRLWVRSWVWVTWPFWAPWITQLGKYSWMIFKLLPSPVVAISRANKIIKKHTWNSWAAGKPTITGQTLTGAHPSPSTPPHPLTVIWQCTYLSTTDRGMFLIEVIPLTEVLMQNYFWTYNFDKETEKMEQLRDDVKYPNYNKTSTCLTGSLLLSCGFHYMCVESVVSNLLHVSTVYDNFNSDW